jgi:uncharacterized protein YprB with RNaseH-like and TPR domain
MNLTARLRSIVRPTTARELTYEPDTGRYEAAIDMDRVADVLGGRVVANAFGRALVIDRRYESDRSHGDTKIGAIAFDDDERLRVLDPALTPADGIGSRIVFVDLETTGLSGGAGTMAFLIGCGWFDVGAFQVRQFLLTSYAAERALLCAVADCLAETALLVTYNGKTFDVPVMETRWLFHRMPPPLESVRHFDMLHPARRLWRRRDGEAEDEACCRLSTLERVVCGVTRAGDVPGMEIPTRYFRFLRTADARPLEPVLEHNRIDLVSLAAVTSSAVTLVEQGSEACRDGCEALALGKVLERAGAHAAALACFQRAADDGRMHIDVRAEALYHLGLRLRRDRRFEEAADVWKRVLALAPSRGMRSTVVEPLRRFAVRQLAIQHEHRERDYEGARELTLQLLEESDREQVDDSRRRLERLDRKIARSAGELFA